MAVGSARLLLLALSALLPTCALAERDIDGLKFPESLEIATGKLKLLGGGTRFKYGVVKVRRSAFLCCRCAHTKHPGHAT